jgi:hypothetical protein
VIGNEDMLEWESLTEILEDFWQNEEDKFVWRLEKSGDYTARSMHKKLTFRGITNRKIMKLWRSRVPNKLKIFVSLDTQDAGVNLLKKRIWRSIKCCLCADVELVILIKGADKYDRIFLV